MAGTVMPESGVAVHDIHPIHGGWKSSTCITSLVLLAVAIGVGGPLVIFYNHDFSDDSHSNSTEPLPNDIIENQLRGSLNLADDC